MESLSEEVGMRVECWNPVEQFDTSHLNGERPRLMALAPSLAAAVGTAAGRL
jgi:nitric oxide reductase activation protein